jgi:hypothetical protein
MALPKNMSAYQDCFDFFDRALGSDRGVQRIFDTQEQALHFRNRLNYARRIMREMNRDTLEPGDPMYNRCEYDHFVVKTQKDHARDKWLCKALIMVLPEEDIEDIPPTNSGFIEEASEEAIEERD